MFYGSLSYCNYNVDYYSPICARTAVAGSNGNVLSMTYDRVSNNEVAVHVVGSGHNPCVLGVAPAVDVQFTIRFRQLCSGVMEFMIDPGGTHDGFPWHELYLNDIPVYRWDPCMSGTNPNALFPPMEVSITTGVNIQNLNQWNPVPNPWTE